VIIDRDDKGNFTHHVYREEQSAQEMFNILGYNQK
jgi:arginine decarboxylase